MALIVSTMNRYGGVYVAPDALVADFKIFERDLLDSMQRWKHQGVKVVWIKIPNTRAELLAKVFQHGFENHHCDKDFIMVTKRLQQDAIIPPYAKHTIGIGGLVINEQHEILTIRELAHIKSHPHNWKFPGGMLDPYEHMQEGVVREVAEETGVKTEFQSFIGFRHHHQGQFSTSNIYAVCRLKPLTFDITIQESEIADARWFPINEYLADEKIGQYNKFILRSALQKQGLKSVKLPGYMSSDEEYEVFMG